MSFIMRNFNPFIFIVLHHDIFELLPSQLFFSSICIRAAYLITDS